MSGIATVTAVRGIGRSSRKKGHGKMNLARDLQEPQ